MLIPGRGFCSGVALVFCSHVKLAVGQSFSSDVHHAFQMGHKSL
jgi:hypothetical protein